MLTNTDLPSWLWPVTTRFIIFSSAVVAPNMVRCNYRSPVHHRIWRVVISLILPTPSDSSP